MTKNISGSDFGPDQHSPSETDTGGNVARVCEVHREKLTVLSATGEIEVTLNTGMSSGDVAVGDWIMLDPISKSLLSILPRKSTIRRKVAGSESDEQLIAANVDTLFIVTSCNADFNIARLERYLALAASGDIRPVIVLTKADLTDSADNYMHEAARLSAIVTVIAVNARDPKSLDQLVSWLRNDETGVLVGSSGVGKSTILNAMTGAESSTQEIREDDAKGRHTTTSRSLKRTRTGGWLIDTPGIRQLALVDGGEAIDKVFSEISDLVEHCRFSDCSHEIEPGCAVRAAIDRGDIDTDRVERWRKLHREDQAQPVTYEEARLRRKSSSKEARSKGNGRGKRRR